MVYGHFLVALFILAGGLSILETAANPYAIAMGPQETSTRRLNLAQSFNPLGSISGVLIGKFLILSQLNEASEQDRVAMTESQLAQVQQAELTAVMGPYVTVAIVIAVVWILIAITRFPHGTETDKSLNLLPTFKRLFRLRHYGMGVVAQFFYVGAQIGVWSFTIRYVMQVLGLNEASAASYYLASIILFSASRFVFTYLMKFIAPNKLLWIMAAGAAALSVVVMGVGGYAGVYALVGISGCMSLMFPTIYGLAVKGLGEDTKIGASALIMAILGGALITAIQGQVSDMAGIHWAYGVPLVCFVVILIYGLKGFRPKQVQVAPAT